MIMTMVMINIDENYPIRQANKAKMKIPKDFNKISPKRPTKAKNGQKITIFGLDPTILVC